MDQVYNHEQMQAYAAELIKEFRLNTSSSRALYSKLDGVQPTDQGKTVLERLANTLVELEKIGGERKGKEYSYTQRPKNPKYTQSTSRKSRGFR